MEISRFLATRMCIHSQATGPSFNFGHNRPAWGLGRIVFLVLILSLFYGVFRLLEASSLFLCTCSRASYVLVGLFLAACSPPGTHSQRCLLPGQSQKALLEMARDSLAHHHANVEVNPLTVDHPAEAIYLIAVITVSLLSVQKLLFSMVFTCVQH